MHSRYSGFGRVNRNGQIHGQLRNFEAGTQTLKAHLIALLSDVINAKVKL